MTAPQNHLGAPARRLSSVHRVKYRQPMERNSRQNNTVDLEEMV
jgi:hypothetical protein